MLSTTVENRKQDKTKRRQNASGQTDASTFLPACDKFPLKPPTLSRYDHFRTRAITLIHALRNHLLQIQSTNIILSHAYGILPFYTQWLLNSDVIFETAIKSLY